MISVSLAIAWNSRSASGWVHATRFASSGCAPLGTVTNRMLLMSTSRIWMAMSVILSTVNWSSTVMESVTELRNA